MKLRNQKNKIENYVYFIYIFLGVAAFFLNFWASNRGVFPIDTFLHYDSANRILSASLTDRILQEKGIEASLKLSESPNSKVIVIGSGDGGLPIILGNN